MKIHFDLKPCGINGHGNDIPCVFDWDEDTGEVSGPDADFLLEYKERDGYVDGYMFTNWQHKLSTAPLNSRADVAAIIYSNGYAIPSELEPFFESEPIPKPEGVAGRDWTW